MRGLTVLVAGLALGGCGSSAFKEAHSLLEQDLRDPHSVQYRDEQKKRAGLCGEFNAKNASGGYVGFRSYVYVPRQGVFADKSDVVTLELPFNEPEMWRQSVIRTAVCIKDGTEAELNAALVKYEKALTAEDAAFERECGIGSTDALRCSALNSPAKRAYEAVAGAIDTGL